MTLAETIKLALDRRAALVAEIVALDAELDEIRTVLGVRTHLLPQHDGNGRPRGRAVHQERKEALRQQESSSATVDTPEIPSLEELTAAARARDTAILERLVSGGPASRNDLLGVLPREPWKTEQQRLSDCSNSLSRLKRKGKVEATSQGWAAIVPSAVGAPAAEEATVPEKAQPPANAQRPERRCGRCCHKFTPTRAEQYVCDGCRDKPKTGTRAPTESELETVWSPGKDAPSLTGSQAGLGATLSGEPFKVGVRRG